MAKVKSRVGRWSEAGSNGTIVVSDLREALEELQSLQEEYQDWRDNLPENLESSTLAEKLDGILEIDIESAISSLDDIENTLSECEGADLPLGFGRD